MAEKVVILDGSGPSDQDLAPVLGVLAETLQQDGSALEVLSLKDLKLAHCIGCFGCWTRTPGICVENDAGRQVAQAFVQSDTAVLFTPVTFGGYSPELKRMTDRFIQLITPQFAIMHNEVHHPPRYTRRPRFLVVGVQRQSNPHEAEIFRTLGGRNALNLSPPSFASEVVAATDSAETLQQRFQSLLTRSDALPSGQAAAELMPSLNQPDPTLGQDVDKRALLIIGSPKTNTVSASSILGSYLLDRLSALGWATDALTLRSSLNREEGQAELLSAVERAGLILLVFPLYADALPYLATRALSLVAAARRQLSPAPPQRLMALVNSGFPESHQNAVALAICREFAAQSGIAWAGGLAMPGGGYVGAEALDAAKRAGPPVKHIVKALDLAAEALDRGQAVPAEAATCLARSPIPMVPFAVWRRLYIHLAGSGFEQEAAKNGVGKARLLEQPYAA